MSATIVTGRHACCSLNAEGLLCILKLGPHVRTAISRKYALATWYALVWTDEDVYTRANGYCTIYMYIYTIWQIACVETVIMEDPSIRSYQQFYFISNNSLSFDEIVEKLDNGIAVCAI